MRSTNSVALGMSILAAPISSPGGYRGSRYTYVYGTIKSNYQKAATGDLLKTDNVQCEL